MTLSTCQPGPTLVWWLAFSSMKWATPLPLRGCFGELPCEPPKGAILCPLMPDATQAQLMKFSNGSWWEV